MEGAGLELSQCGTGEKLGSARWVARRVRERGRVVGKLRGSGAEEKREIEFGVF